MGALLGGAICCGLLVRGDGLTPGCSGRRCAPPLNRSVDMTSDVNRDCGSPYMVVSSRPCRDERGAGPVIATVDPADIRGLVTTLHVSVGRLPVPAEALVRDVRAQLPLRHHLPRVRRASTHGRRWRRLVHRRCALGVPLDGSDAPRDRTAWLAAQRRLIELLEQAAGSGASGRVAASATRGGKAACARAGQGHAHRPRRRVGSS